MEEQIRYCNIGYDLDGGGYSFEPPPEALGNLGVVVWEDPDTDYIPWVVGDDDHHSRREFFGLSAPLYAFAPNSGHFQRTVWPSKYKVGEDTFYLVRDGTVNESERECSCEGDEVDCDRCDGEGYVTSPGGEWALYALQADTNPITGTHKES